MEIWQEGQGKGEQSKTKKKWLVGDDKSKSLLHPHAERSISHSGEVSGGVCHPGCQCAEMKMDGSYRERTYGASHRGTTPGA